MQLAARVSLLVALFIASVRARESCTTDSYGQSRGLQIPLPKLPLLNQHALIKIPNDCPDPRSYVGMKITVCDSNGAPEVTAESLYYAVVHLQEFSGNAVAYITEYCDSDVVGSQVDDVDDNLSENLKPIAYELNSDE